jgi:hypothetical protein
MKSNPAKYRSGHSGYVSEYDQFMDSFLSSHPEVDEKRRRAWYIWWDHPLDADELAPKHANDVPAKPYQYE